MVRAPLDFVVHFGGVFKLVLRGFLCAQILSARDLKVNRYFLVNAAMKIRANAFIKLFRQSRIK